MQKQYCQHIRHRKKSQMSTMAEFIFYCAITALCLLMSQIKVSCL